MPEKTLITALYQHSCTSNRSENLDKISHAIEQAAAKGVQLLLLQELHNSLYFCQTEETSQFDLAETIPGPTTQQLSALASQFNMVIVSSLFEKRAAGLYHNTSVVLDADGSIAGQYRKMHIPDDPGFYEKFYFTPGDLGFEPIKTQVGKLGVLVCWDQWFPEAARLMAMAGAEILLYPTAIGWDDNDSDDEKQRQLNAWITIQRSHAIANGIPVMSCNRTGIEYSPDQQQQIHFWGNSFICGPQGEILQHANEEETLMIGEINLSRSEEVRRIWPYLRDRRIDAYQDLVLRYRDKSKSNDTK